MHAYLIVGQTQEKREEEVLQLLKKLEIPEIIELKTSQKHTIEDLRNLQNSLTLSSPQKRAVVVYEAQNLTQDAANAFLKTLEEPPQDTYLLLTAENAGQLSETVVSRTQIIDLGVEQLNPQGVDEQLALLNKLFRASLLDRFEYVDTLNDREKALLFIKGQIIAARLKLVSGSKDTGSLVNLIDRLIKAKEDIEQNVNVKLAVTDLIMQYS